MDFSNLPFLEKIAANIDKDKEQELVSKFQANGPDYKSAYKQLRRAYQPMIDSLVRRSKSTSANVPDTILYMRAETEFPKILRSYNPDKGTAVGTHVFERLKGHLQNAVGERRPGPYVPRNNQMEAGRLSQAIRDAQRKYDVTDPTDEQILEFYPGRTKEDIETNKKYLFRSFVGDKPMEVDNEGSPVTLGDMFTGESVLEDPDDEYHLMKIDRLEQLMKDKLSPEKYAVVRARHVEGKPMASIALSHGMSTTKLRSILSEWDRIRDENNGV